MLNKWNYRFINLALEVSTWSKEYTKVGCVAVDRNTNKVLACGYNGLPYFANDSSLKSLEQSDKSLLVLHAEYNCLDQLSKDDYFKEIDLYVTRAPCKLCSLKIIHSKANIKSLYYVPNDNEDFNNRYNVDESIELLNSNGINTYSVNGGRDFTFEIVVSQYLQGYDKVSDEPITIDSISEFISKCKLLIDNLDDYLRKNTSYIESLIDILADYGWSNLLEFSNNNGSTDPKKFLDWYKSKFKNK